MAKPDVGAVAERLLTGFIHPLVVGGAMTPGRPIGARTALAIGDGTSGLLPASAQGDRPLGDIDKVAHVQLARVRVARKLAPVDRVEGLRAHEWALCAALHDLVQTTHPELKGALRPRAPNKLLDLVDATIARVPPPASVLDALSRHTLFSRMLEITRTDTTVSWWVGARTFLGTEPPARLGAWPELRRVHVAQSPRALMALPTSGGAVNPDSFEASVRAFLAKTPVTDVATAARPAPRFAWSAEALALTGTRAGRTLVVRALALQPADAVDDALGRATRALFAQQQWRAAALALEVLGERALAAAEQAIARRDAPTAQSLGQGETAFARAAGAITARRWLDAHAATFDDAERAALIRALEPATMSRAAQELESFVSALPR